MVALSPHFTTLAALCYIATVSVYVSVDAAAINARHGVESATAHGVRGNIPVIPLPSDVSDAHSTHSRKLHTKPQVKDPGNKVKIGAFLSSLNTAF